MALLLDITDKCMSLQSIHNSVKSDITVSYLHHFNVAQLTVFYIMNRTVYNFYSACNSNTMFSLVLTSYVDRRK